MHELAVTQSLIQSVLTECKNKNIKNIKKINVELGALTSYVDDSILFYFDLIKKDFDLLKDTLLIIHVKKGIIKCNECKKKSIIKDPYIIICEYCQSTDIKIIDGKEFIIKELEITKGDSNV